MSDPKSKFDAIPLNPPGIINDKPAAKPDVPLFGTTPPAEKPATKKAAEPEKKPEPATPSTVAVSSMPDWVKSIFVPNRTHGVLAIAATSLFGGWYGVKMLLPPPMFKETSAKGTTPKEPTIPNDLSRPNPTASVSASGSGVIQPTVPSAIDPVTSVPPPPSSSVGQSLPTPVVPIVPPPPVNQAGYTESGPMKFQIPSVTETTSPTPPPAVKIEVPAVTLPSVTESSGATSTPPALPTAIPIASPPTTSPTVTPVAGTGTPPGLPLIPQVPSSPPPPPTENKAIGIPDVTSPKGVVSLPSTTSTATSPPPPPPVIDITPKLTIPAVTTPTVTPTVTPMSPPPGTLPIQPTPSTPAPVTAIPAVASSMITPTATSTATSTMNTPTQTDFDVDLHYVKNGESFASIAKQHYGDERYGQALELFNRRQGFNGRVVQVPPTHWIKKQTGNPTARAATEPTNSGNWTGVTASSTTPTIELRNDSTFRGIARDVYGSEQQWNRIFDLNPTFSSDAVIPKGTKIKLPADAKVGQ